MKTKIFTKTILRWIGDTEPTVVVPKEPEDLDPGTIRVEVRVAPKKTAGSAVPKAREKINGSPVLRIAAVIALLVAGAIGLRITAQRAPTAAPISVQNPEINPPEESPPAALAEAPIFPGENWDSQVAAVQTQAEKIANEGYDVAPVADLMQKAGGKKGQGDEEAARALVAQAFALAVSKEGLRRPRPPGAPEEIEARLHGKMETLQKRVQEMAAKGRDHADVRDKMSGFEGLMKSGEVIKAEALLDEALELAH